MREDISRHTESFYAATVASDRHCSKLTAEARAQVCVIGGGFTGLAAALELAKRGIRVALLEAGPIAWGASGRNGGQVHVGWRRSQQWLERNIGRDDARHLWKLALDARSHLDELISDHPIDCDFRPGHLHGDHKRRFIPATKAEVEHLREQYDYRHIRFVGHDEVRAMVGTDDYFGGSFDDRGGQLHPLKLALGMADVASSAGASLHPFTRVQSIDRCAAGWRVRADSGTVVCDTVLLACGGYATGLNQSVDAHVMPMNNYIAVTRPLGEKARSIINGSFAVSDSRFVIYYYRLTPDHRLLFGGGESYSYRFPRDIAALVRPHLAKVFPQLSDVEIDYAWGGTLSVTPTRLPFVRQLRPGLFNVSGFSGLGLVLAPYLGKVVGEAIAGERAIFDRLEALPVPSFPGGRWLRWPTLAAAMSFLALRDRL